MLKPRLLVLLAARLRSTAGAAIKLCALNEWQIVGGRSLVAVDYEEAPGAGPAGFASSPFSWRSHFCWNSTPRSSNLG